MAQADGVVANGTGSAVRADINGQLAALFTNHSGSTEPATTFAFQTWADTNTNTLKLRNSSNDGWVQLARLDGQFDAKTFNGNITLNAQSDLRLADSDSSNWVAFQAPATVASNVTWTLPAADGTSGQTLQTNGSGTLSWSTPSASVDKIEEGNTSAEVVDTGSDGHFKVVTEGTEALRVNASQNVGFGTASPTNRIHSYASNNAARTDHIRLQNDGADNGTESAITFTQNSATEQACIFSSKDASGPSLNIEISGAQMGRFTNNGQFIVGTVPSSLPSSTLVVEGSSDGTDGNPTLHFSRQRSIGSATGLGIVSFGKNDKVGAQVLSMSNGTWTEGSSQPSQLRFLTTPSGSTTLTERMRISEDGGIQILQNGGALLINTTTTLSAHKVGIAGDSQSVLYCNRNGNDGNLLTFFRDGSEVGVISVASGTVSYGGGHISRWSQLPNNAERTEILMGSVLSNLDEMCEWAYDAEPEVLWEEGEELPEGVQVGDVKTPARPAGTEDNIQLNRMKVSDVEGDPNVAGVFQNWDDDDDTYTNDFFCAMTGDFVIRIAQGVTVERGDLLMSAGDGTAKPQDDDIIRSKTIAKVTSTNVSCTYDDGSYCVPCVLMAC